MLDKLAEDLAAQLGSLTEDLAELASARLEAINTIAEIKAELLKTPTRAGMGWRAKHELEQGRVDTELLLKAFKKEELAHLAMIAIRAINKIMHV
jgi:chorismate mutase